MSSDPGMVARLVGSVLGQAATARVLSALEIDPAVDTPSDVRCPRGTFAAALAICLFDDLLARVPSGAAYVGDRVAAGGKVTFDHGALRTIRFASGATGALPGGEDAFARILEPLGYRVAGVYPLPALRMTGRAYRHLDQPETIPQYFVSELHVDRFDQEFAGVAARVFGTSRDPLGAAAIAVLDDFASGGTVSFAAAAAALPEILTAFGRQHDQPALADYETLLAHSAEAAWIATEGNAFNHATDRVADVAALAAVQQALGRPMKARVEVSASGRVRQTAFMADHVTRRFTTPDGEIERTVPGSFYEFISRATDPATGALDLGFDSGNATGIFQMTRAPNDAGNGMIGKMTL